jgi:hypothetical protein
MTCSSMAVSATSGITRPSHCSTDATVASASASSTQAPRQFFDRVASGQSRSPARARSPFMSIALHRMNTTCGKASGEAWARSAYASSCAKAAPGSPSRNCTPAMKTSASVG